MFQFYLRPRVDHARSQHTVPCVADLEYQISIISICCMSLLTLFCISPASPTTCRPGRRSLPVRPINSAGSQPPWPQPSCIPAPLVVGPAPTMTLSDKIQETRPAWRGSRQYCRRDEGAGDAARGSSPGRLPQKPGHSVSGCLVPRAGFARSRHGTGAQPRAQPSRARLCRWRPQPPRPPTRRSVTRQTGRE